LNNLNTEQRKVFALGLDGATFSLIRPWVEKGELPYLERLMKEGVHGVLDSIIHPFSAQAWTSFMTGQNPGKHGIFDFIEEDPYTYDFHFINASSRKSKSLWKILSEEGKKVCVVNVPFTYPAEKVNGCLIAGMDAPGLESDFIYPRSLYQEIKKEIGNYVIELSVRDYIRNNKEEEFLKAISDTIDMRVKTIKYLAKNKPWDFFLAVFRATDQVQHFFWKYMDPEHPFYEKYDVLQNAILDVYKKLDAGIEMIHGLLPPETTLVIMSDHGEMGNGNKAIYLNKWLESLGLLNFKGTSRGNFTYSKLILRCRPLARKILSRKMKNFIIRKIPQIRDMTETMISYSQVDWSRTKAYSDEMRGNIRINLKGKKEKGIVLPGPEYENLINMIKQKLLEIVDPETDEKIFENIYSREEIYDGPFVEKAPNILLERKESGYLPIYRPSCTVKNSGFFQAFAKEDVAKDPPPNGGHSLKGILLMKGKGIKRRCEIKGAKIIDLAPTILHLMGLSIPNSMHGKVLEGALEEDYREQNPIRFKFDDSVSSSNIGEYTEEESKIIEARLKDLGYLG